MNHRRATRAATAGALAAALLLHTAPGAAPAWAQQNKYKDAMVGTWSIEGEADLFVLEKNNSCHRMDEDGIKTSRPGRWNVDSRRLTMELKYNGKRYRSVFAYEMVSKDHFKLTIVKATVDGKPKKPKKAELVAKRWNSTNR